MKKNFFAGLLTGLCGALVLFTVIGAIFVYVQGQNAQKEDSIYSESEDNSGSGSSTAKAAETKDEVPYDDIMYKLSYLQKLVDKYYLDDVKSVDFADGIYKGFIASLDDPYSVYYTKEEYSALMESSSGTYAGIGATVSQNADTHIITIVKPFKDSPASKAGLLPGDIIYKINGTELTDEDLTEVVSMMKGKEGTTVDITVVRKGESKPLDFTITRAKIEVPTIEWQMLDNNIGYITISEFDEITVSQFMTAVDELTGKGMKGLVVDVRNNPGGLLDSVVQILDRI